MRRLLESVPSEGRGVSVTLSPVHRIAGRDSLILRHRNTVVTNERALQRAAAKGDMTRLRNGAYVLTTVWRSLTPADRRRLEAAATADLHAGYIASHRSAGALWHIPTIQRPDGLVHARVTAAAGSRIEHGVRKHAVADLDLHLTSIDGIAVTTLEPTVLDIAATEPFADGVVAADWALRQHVSKDRLRTVLGEWSPARGRRRVEGVIDFADGDAGSAGESWSRAQMAEGCLPPPVLQQEFSDRDGLIGFVDFWWPAHNRVGEFDGLKKYKEATLLRGRAPGDVVTDEKVREDRLRATGTRPFVDRWTWATLVESGALVRRLVAAGLPRVR